MKKLFSVSAIVIVIFINNLYPQYLSEPTTMSAGGEFNLMLQKSIMRGDDSKFKVPGIFSPQKDVDALTTTFDAINFDGNSPLNGGYLFIPPDVSGAAGPSHVVNVVNCAVQFYTKTGTQTYSQSLQTFFTSLNPTNSMFDPKVIYDQYNGRFLIVALETNTTPTNISYIHLAVSDDNNPNGTWYYTKINSKFTISSVDYWTDYPGFSCDQNAIYITGNLFKFSGTGTAVSRLWIINKSPFYTGGTASVNVYDPCTSTGVSSTTMMPTHMYGTAQTNVGTFLVRYSGFSDGTNEYLSIIRVDNPLGTPSFNHQYVYSGDIDKVNLALDEGKQLGTTTTISTNDRRALSVVWRNNYLYTCATVKPLNAADSNQATAHWWKVNTATLGSLTISDQGNISGEEISSQCHTFFPSIAVDSAGNMAVGFSATSSSIYPGAYFSYRLASDAAGTMRTPEVLKAGTDYYIRKFGGSRNRWGDYTGISPDPSEEGSFWVYNEYAMTRGTLLSGEDGRWATVWGKFVPGSSSPYPLVNGVIAASEYGTHTNGQNQETSGSTVWYMTWDNTNLYLGISAANVSEGAVIYIDKNPVVPINGGSNSSGTIPGQNYDNTNFAELQFRSDFVCYFKNGYKEYRTANGTNSWSSATTTFGNYADNASNVREISIPWSAMGGKPAQFNWFGYVTSGSGYVYGQVPTENSSAFIGTSARYVRYYTVAVTDSATATKPFSLNSFVFNSTADMPTFGAISVYDFTMNSSGRIITRTGGAWTINNSLRIDKGTINFGGITDGATITADVVIDTSGSLTLSGSVGGDLTLSGSFTVNGAFNCNNRLVQFNGSSNSVISGNAADLTIDYLTINKTGGSTLNLNRALSVNKSLNFSNGNLLLNNYDLKLSTSAGVSGPFNSSKMIVVNGTGKAIKYFPAASSFLFPVGEITGVTEYSPVTLNFLSGTFGGSAYASVGVTNSKHPNNNSTTNYLNRYWSINQNGITSFVCDVTAVYSPLDVAGTESQIYCGKYSSAVWTLYNPVNTMTKELLANGVTSFSDITGGQMKYMGGSGFLNITSIFEGFYDSGLNLMRKKDTLTVELHSSSAPYSKIDETKILLDSVSFSGTAEFTNAATGNYYIVLKHRNALETWSKSGGFSYTRGAGSMSYNFTTAATQAYGDNLVLKGSKLCMYSGDANQDGQISLDDLLAIDADNQNFATGYLSTDINGDGQVTLDDLLITDANNQNFISVQKPGTFLKKNTKELDSKED